MPHPAPLADRVRAWFGRAVPGRVRSVLAVLALLALLASIVWNVQLNIALAAERTMRSELAAVIGQQEVVLDIIDSKNSVKWILRPTDAQSRAYGKIYSRPDMPQIVAMTGRLPAPPLGKNYQLWLVRVGRTEWAGAVDVNSAGFGLLVYKTTANGPTYDRAEITAEARGATSPSGSPVLEWQADK